MLQDTVRNNQVSLILNHNGDTSFLPSLKPEETSTYLWKCHSHCETLLHASSL